MLYPLRRPAQSKQNVGPISLGNAVLHEFLFQALLDCFGIRSLMLGCGRVFEHSSEAPQFPMNSLSTLHGVFLL